MPETYDLTVKNMFSDMADDIISYLTGFKIKKLDELQSGSYKENFRKRT